MNIRINYVVIIVLTLSLLGCEPIGANQPTTSPSEGVSTGKPVSSNSLFIESKSVGVIDEAPYIVRYRFVQLNLDLLLDENQQALKLKPKTEIQINLFPDATYTGVIERVEDSGDAITWVGYLKDVEFSELTMVYTGGVFIGHFASPDGVYEISLAGEDLYRIVKIDQTLLPGGEGDLYDSTYVG